jgi:hypothetical protein
MSRQGAAGAQNPLDAIDHSPLATAELRSSSGLRMRLSHSYAHGSRLMIGKFLKYASNSQENKGRRELEEHPWLVTRVMAHRNY